MEYRFVELNDERTHIEHPDLKARVWLERNGSGRGWTLRWSGREEGIHRFDWPHYARTEEDLGSRAQLVLDRALAEHQLGGAPSWDQIMEVARREP